ncbi:MAG: protein translocase subunit SecF [Clostridia bacterium]|nr:protein translocase subunit SecF [Clostridia bacterium]
MFKSVKITEKSKIFFIISAILVVAAIVLLIFPGLKLGLDFTEGATVTVSFNQEYVGDLQGELEDFIGGKNENDKFDVKNVRVINGGASLQFDLSYKYDGVVLSQQEFSEKLTAEDTGLLDTLKDKINNDCSAFFGESTENVLDEGVTYSFTSPDATKALTSKAALAISIAIVAMLIYIGIRFKFTSGIAAIIVLIHDVLVMLLLTAAFRITVNTTFIAAVITVIGYSINATIIVFDRIKENLVKYEGKGLTDGEVANISIKETMRRTIFTTITTLVMIVLVAIFGVASIREFALPIIFGLLSGVYSAIVLSSCVWVQIRKIASKMNFGKKKTSYQKHVKAKAVKEA